MENGLDGTQIEKTRMVKNPKSCKIITFPFVKYQFFDKIVQKTCRNYCARAFYMCIKNWQS